MLAEQHIVACSISMHINSMQGWLLLSSTDLCVQICNCKEQKEGEKTLDTRILPLPKTLWCLQVNKHETDFRLPAS